MIINKFINLFHIYICLFPSLIYVLPCPIKYSYYYEFYKYMILTSILIPVHWGILGDKCILTLISQYLGDFDNKIKNNNNIEIDKTKNDKTKNDNDLIDNSPFIEYYCKNNILRIFKIFNLEYNDKNFKKIIYLYWFFNEILIWNFTFRYMI